MKVTFFKLLALCAIFSPLTAITGKTQNKVWSWLTTAYSDEQEAAIARLKLLMEKLSSIKRSYPFMAEQKRGTDAHVWLWTRLTQSFQVTRTLQRPSRSTIIWICLMACVTRLVPVFIRCHHGTTHQLAWVQQILLYLFSLYFCQPNTRNTKYWTQFSCYCKILTKIALEQPNYFYFFFIFPCK